jgi:hypothetical protein
MGCYKLISLLTRSIGATRINYAITGDRGAWAPYRSLSLTRHYYRTHDVVQISERIETRHVVWGVTHTVFHFAVPVLIQPWVEVSARIFEQVWPRIWALVSIQL